MQLMLLSFLFHFETEKFNCLQNHDKLYQIITLTLPVLKVSFWSCRRHELKVYVNCSFCIEESQIF